MSQMFSLRNAARLTRPTHSLSVSRRMFGGHGIYEKGNADSPVPEPLWGQNERSVLLSTRLEHARGTAKCIWLVFRDLTTDVHLK